MLRTEIIYNAFASCGIDFYTGVPDSLLKDFCAWMIDQTGSHRHIVAANEGTAIGLAAGHYLATEHPALVYMQNSGLGNAVNPLLSLADKQVYQIPMILLVGWRGQPDGKDEPQHEKQGRVTPDLLDAMQIPYVVLAPEESKAIAQIRKAVCDSGESHSPCAILVRKETFEPYPWRHRQPAPRFLTREQALKTVLERLGDRDIIVSTTGKISRELYEYRVALHQGHDRDFLTVGSMGHSSAIALGIALSKPARKVYCFDGDGAFLMHMGVVANIGTANAENYNHIVFNNGVHESVGGLPTAAGGIDITKIAVACGYRNAFAASTKEEIHSAMETLRALEGPGLLEIKIAAGSRADLSRPKTTPVENKNAFMRNLKK